MQLKITVDFRERSYSLLFGYFSSVYDMNCCIDVIGKLRLYDNRIIRNVAISSLDTNTFSSVEIFYL